MYVDGLALFEIMMPDGVGGSQAIQNEADAAAG